MAKANDPLNEVNRRFGRISGALALVYIAVFVKFGLWQALTERCCGAVETAGVGTAIAIIYLFSVHQLGESSFQVMSVLFQYVALSLFFMGVTEGFFPLAQEFRQKGDAAAYSRLVRVVRMSAVKAGLGISVLLSVCSPWAPGWVGVDGPEAVQATRMLVILIPFLPVSALLMVRVAELFEARKVMRGVVLVLFKDLIGLAGLTVLGGAFWGMDGLWCGMLATLTLALPLAFLPNCRR